MVHHQHASSTISISNNSHSSILITHFISANAVSALKVFHIYPIGKGVFEIKALGRLKYFLCIDVPHLK